LDDDDESAPSQSSQRREQDSQVGRSQKPHLAYDATLVHTRQRSVAGGLSACDGVFWKRSYRYVSTAIAHSSLGRYVDARGHLGLSSSSDRGRLRFGARRSPLSAFW